MTFIQRILASASNAFELSEGDVRLPKLFRQTVSQHWPGGGKSVVTELVA